MQGSQGHLCAYHALPVDTCLPNFQLPSLYTRPRLLVSAVISKLIMKSKIRKDIVKKDTRRAGEGLKEEDVKDWNK